MKLIINLLLFAITISCFAQKKLVDNETPKNWEKLENYGISDDGKFVWYKQVSPSYGSKIILKSTDGRFERVFDNVATPKFTKDGDYFICNYHRKDSTSIIDLNSKKEIFIRGRAYKSLNSENGDVIACKDNNQLELMNLKSKKSSIYKNVGQFEFSPDGSLLLMVKFGNENSWLSVNTSTLMEQVISRGIIGSWNFDSTGQKLAYITKDSLGNKLWLYDFSTKSNRVLSIPGLDSNVKISDGMLKISPDGKMLYFEVERDVNISEPNVLTDHLKIWSYKDNYAQSMKRTSNPEVLERLLMAYHISSSRIIPVIEDGLKLFNEGKYFRRYVLLTNNRIDRDAFYQGKDTDLILLDTETGNRKRITVNYAWNGMTSITRDEKFVIWYDIASHRYYSYEISSGVKRDLSGSIPFPTDDLNDTRKIRPEKDLRVYGGDLVRVSKEEERLIIADEYDLWQIDPSNREKAFCLTGGTGRVRNIKFKMIPAYSSDGKEVISNTVLIAGMDFSTKYNGIFALDLSKRQGLKTIVPMQASTLASYSSFRPQKAKAVDAFVYVKQNANQSPNLFFNDGHGQNIKMSDIHPENEYNWITSELHNYKLVDGTSNQGILYKPENFDPAKKYPVIFYYYELMSFSLNNFIQPIQSQCELTIPWYVSNGYLVFVPDVTHQRPNPGDRIYDCITSAAKHIASLPFVDSKRMGLQGHSYGGYETNLMITRSNLFAAAQSSAGLSNLTSHYGTPIFGGYPGSNWAENGQLNMPGKLWEHKDLYVRDSPVFQADKVRTPLLMMHGTKDDQVPISQAIEMYFALRKLNKPVWLLEYEDEYHYLENEKNIEDFAIRQQQFFDHYLKGKPMPVWMSRGIPSWERKIKSGLELDTIQTSK